MLNQGGEPTTPHKLTTGMKPSVSNQYVLFFHVMRKSHVDTKVLSMHHQSQKRFLVVFIGIPQHQKEYLIYVPIVWKIVSSHDVLFYKTFSSALAYTSCLYSGELSM